MSQLYEIDSQGNKKIISGMITGERPKYTMAEYTALTDKPIDWICTDYDATSEYGINATEVKYDSNNSVKDKIDTKAQIVTTHFSATTSVAGLVGYDLDIDKLIKAYAQQGENYYILVRQTSTGKCAFFVIDGALNIVANTNVTIYLQYWQ